MGDIFGLISALRKNSAHLNTEAPYVVRKVERRPVGSTIRTVSIMPNKEEKIDISLPSTDFHPNTECIAHRESVVPSSALWPPNIRIDHVIEVHITYKL